MSCEILQTKSLKENPNCSVADRDQLDFYSFLGETSQQSLEFKRILQSIFKCPKAQVAYDDHKLHDVQTNIAQKQIRIKSTKFVGVVRIVRARLAPCRNSRVVATFRATEGIKRPDTSCRRVGPPPSAFLEHLLLRVELLRLQLKFFNLSLTGFKFTLQAIYFCLILFGIISDMIELLLDFFPLFFGNQFFFAGEKPTYLFVQVGEFFLQICVFLFLIGDVVLPVNEFQVGGLNIFLEFFGAFDGCLDFEVGLLLLDLFLETSDFGLQNFILRFVLVYFLDF